MQFVLIALSFAFMCISKISATELRFLDSTTTANTTTSKNVTLYMVPKCTSDDDCSLNGNCNKLSGICECNYNYDTIIKYGNVTKTYDSILLDIANNKNNTSSKIINLTNEDVKFCNYKQKYQLTAFMLSFFVGFGAEHFYLENNNVAAAKFVFYVFCCGLNIVYFILYKFVKNGKKYVEFIGTFEAFYLACGFVYMILWNIYDWVNIGYGVYHDGNGIKMASWNQQQ